VRAGDARVEARTQDSIAVSATGDRWLVVNASPDVLRQIERFAPLQPAGGPGLARGTPIAAVAVTNGDLDHVVGLLSLRESQSFAVLATEPVRRGLVERNAMLRTLARSAEHVSWRALELGQELVLGDVGVGVTPVAVPGKLPIHLMGLAEPSPEDNVALRIRDLAAARTLLIATAVGSLEGVETLVEGADAVFFDGTFWTEDELVAAGLGHAFARDMAHVPVGGEAGSLARLAGIRASRRVFTHVNNTNPMLRSDSPERAAVERAGWEIARDGLEVSL
jgi:pyrroloquinoline quinone biosynthesis protein B